MRCFDLHCDTITRCMDEEKSLYENDLHVDLVRAKFMETYIQCYAAFVPDSLEGEEAFFYFCRAAAKLNKEIIENRRMISRCEKPGDIKGVEGKKPFGAILTVENGKALGGKLENIEKMKELGVKMMTLTWNGANELGRGVRAMGKGGLTDFGRQAVAMMENAGIVVDISHAGHELFYDVAEIAQKPIVASHSNAIRICSSPRNLTDDQFTTICRKGGLVGLNFYVAFLNNDPDKACMEDILRHAEYFLSLGGEDSLAMGSDFDGAELPEDINGIQAVGELYELFLRKNYNESLLDKIFYKNAVSFFIENNLL